MTQCNPLNLKLTKSQINKLKSGIKTGTQVTLIFHQMWLEVLTVGLIFRINYY